MRFQHGKFSFTPERCASEDKTVSDYILQFIALLCMTVMPLFPYMEVCPLINETAAIRGQITAVTTGCREKFLHLSLYEPIHKPHI